MKHFQKLVVAGIATLGAVSSALADDYNIKYCCPLFVKCT